MVGNKQSCVEYRRELGGGGHVEITKSAHRRRRVLTVALPLHVAQSQAGGSTVNTPCPIS